MDLVRSPDRESSIDRAGDGKVIPVRIDGDGKCLEKTDSGTPGNRCIGLLRTYIRVCTLRLPGG